MQPGSRATLRGSRSAPASEARAVDALSSVRGVTARRRGLAYARHAARSLRAVSALSPPSAGCRPGGSSALLGRQVPGARLPALGTPGSEFFGVLLERSAQSAPVGACGILKRRARERFILLGHGRECSTRCVGYPHA